MLVTICALLFITLALAVGLAPRSTEIIGSEACLHTWMKTFHYELEKVNSYEILDDKGITWTNSVRIFAVGWPLKRYGWVWTRDRGIILAMANDPRHQVLLKMGKRLLLISPDSEGKLLRQLNAQRPAQA